jgi:hypothetical protein
MFAIAIIGGLIGLFLGAMALAFILFLFVFWIWMLIDAVRNKGLADGEKVGWVLAIVFFHFIGSLLYLIIGRPKRL